MAMAIIIVICAAVVNMRITLAARPYKCKHGRTGVSKV